MKDSGEGGILQVDTYPALIHAIAAVKELHTIVEQKDRDVVALRQRLDKKDEHAAALEERIGRMERALAALTAGGPAVR